MPELRIILIWRHVILREIMLALLAQAQLEPVADYEQPTDPARVLALAPSHILWEVGEAEDGRFLTSLLQHHAMTIICFSLEDSQLTVFQRQNHPFASSADLINLLQPAN